ncbi:MAG: hypothetical protein H6733_16605 [Alphaproteobacteria bacterium]|nr:hypothetical protein [Alphaproteobacteria bacterium]
MVVGGQVHDGTWHITSGSSTKGAVFVYESSGTWYEEVRLATSVSWPLDCAVGGSWTLEKAATTVPEDRAAYACTLVGAHHIYRFTFDATPGTTCTCT